MRARRKRILLLIGLIVAGTVARNLSREPEPVYQGKTLSSWLMSNPSKNGPAGYDPRKAEAVRSIGTNAVPWLVKWIRYRTPAWRFSLAGFAARLPRPISSLYVCNWIDQTGTRILAFEAAYAFSALGQNARVAFPELRDIATAPTQGINDEIAIEALLNSGNEALPSLLAVAANPNLAAKAITPGRIMNHGIHLDSGVLGRYLNDNDRLVRQGATNIATRIAPELLTNAPPR